MKILCEKFLLANSVQYVALGPSCPGWSATFPENDKIFRREKNAEKNERSRDFLISSPFI